MVCVAAKNSSNILQTSNFQKTFVVKQISKSFGFIDRLKQKIQNYNISDKTRLAIILMVIGLVLLIVAGSIKDYGIVYAVGAIFFFIGAIILLFDLLGISI